MWIIDSRCPVVREPVAGDPVAVTSPVANSPAVTRVVTAAAPLFPGTAMTVHTARASARGAGP